MIKYLRMKKNEIKVKAMLYGIAADIINNQKDILDFISNMYMALKDVPAAKLQDEFISRLAEIIHDENKKNP